MTDITKSTSCLIISAIGWLIFFCGIIYMMSAPVENEFSTLANFGVLFLFAIGAAIIHILNFVIGFILIVQRTQYKRLYIPGLLCSSAYIIFLVIPYFYLVYFSPQDEDTQRELDVRWREYTNDYQAPIKEIQLNESCFGLIFTKSAIDQHALFASTSGSEIILADLTQEKQLLTLGSHYGSTQSLSFSPEGTKAVSGGDNGEVNLWDLQKGLEINHKKGHKDYVRCVSYCPEGNQALSGGDSGEILLWDLEDMQIAKRFVGHTSGIRFDCLVWSKDARKFLSGSWDGSIRLWDVNTGTELSHLQAGYGRVMSIALTPDGKYALSSYLSGPDNPVIYWDLDSKKEINRFGVPGNSWHTDQQLHIESVAFSSDGKTALFGLVFGTAIWWDLNEWKPIAMNRLFKKELAYVYFSKDDSQCIAVGCDESVTQENAKIRFWELPKQ